MSSTPERQVPEGITKVIMMSLPVVCQFDHRVLCLITISHESEGELADG